jgi:hypothetical protein
LLALIACIYSLCLVLNVLTVCPMYFSGQSIHLIFTYYGIETRKIVRLFKGASMKTAFRTKTQYKN